MLLTHHEHDACHILPRTCPICKEKNRNALLQNRVEAILDRQRRERSEHQEQKDAPAVCSCGMEGARRRGVFTPLKDFFIKNSFVV